MSYSPLDPQRRTPRLSAEAREVARDQPGHADCAALGYIVADEEGEADDMTRKHHFETLEASANGGGPSRTTDWCCACGTLRHEYAGGTDANHPSEYRMGGGPWTYHEPACPGSTERLLMDAHGVTAASEPAGAIATRLFNKLRAMWEAGMVNKPFSARSTILYAQVAAANALREMIVEDEERQAKR